MSNLWPQLSRFAVPAESQLAEGGGAYPNDRFWNCVFACVSVALQVYGYPDLEPEDMRQLVQPGTHAGSDFGRVAAYLHSHPERWPNLPRIDTWNPVDTISTLGAMLDKGYVTILDVWDDRNANILSGPLSGWGGTHAVLLEAKGLTTVTVWNPWNGETAGQTFTHAYLRGATTGQYVGDLMVFARSILPQPAPTPTPIPIKPPPPPPPPPPSPPVVVPSPPPVIPPPLPPPVVPPVVPEPVKPPSVPPGSPSADVNDHGNVVVPRGTASWADLLWALLDWFRKLGGR